MEIKLKGTSVQYEFGSFQSVERNYLFIVRYDECESSVTKAISLCQKKLSEGNASTTFRLLNDMSGEESFLIEGTTKQLNYALREDNLYWSTSFSGSVSSEQSSVDIFNLPVVVAYDGIQQVAQYQRYIGTGQITARCITEREQSAAWLMDAFLETVNVESFRGFGPGVVMCQSVSVEPFDVNRKGFPAKYKYEFTFGVKKSGWWPWVYFQNGEGLPPIDLVYGTGYGPLDGTVLQAAYTGVDYNGIWPFTLPWVDL